MLVKQLIKKLNDCHPDVPVVLSDSESELKQVWQIERDLVAFEFENEKTEPEFVDDGIVGRFFHSFVEGRVHWQGRVLSQETEGGIYLVQLFEWFLGEPSDMVLVNLQDMMGWKFYDSVEHMNDAYDRKYREEAERHAKKTIEDISGKECRDVL